MKIIRFKTTFGPLKGCEHESNIDQIAIVEIVAPENIDELEKEPWKLAMYIEKTTKLFVLDQQVIEKDLII